MCTTTSAQWPEAPAASGTQSCTFKSACLLNPVMICGKSTPRRSLVVTSFQLMKQAVSVAG
jgi:hypothetical protein